MHKQSSSLVEESIKSKLFNDNSLSLYDCNEQKDPHTALTTLVLLKTKDIFLYLLAVQSAEIYLLGHNHMDFKISLLYVEVKDHKTSHIGDIVNRKVRDIQNSYGNHKHLTE